MYKAYLDVSMSLEPPLDKMIGDGLFWRHKNLLCPLDPHCGIVCDPVQGLSQFTRREPPRLIHLFETRIRHRGGICQGVTSDHQTSRGERPVLRV